MQPQEIIKQYRNLWKIEKAFRISKSDLKKRPIFHRLEKRMKAHLLLCFMSLLVIKETGGAIIWFGVYSERAIEVLGEVGQGKVEVGGVMIETDSQLTPEAQTILPLFAGH